MPVEVVASGVVVVVAAEIAAPTVNLGNICRRIRLAVGNKVLYID
jgi:hypothetical protein